MTKDKKNKSLDLTSGPDLFSSRHIGLENNHQKLVLETLGYSDMSSFIKDIIPENILENSKLELDDALSEEEALERLKIMASKNKLFRSFIGQGYYNTFTPKVILRNVFENPGWYTSYTPYQAEISQGRLEALINFQTMVSDLTGLEISNASLLDEATAAAEAMTLARRVSKSPSEKFFVDEKCFQQTINVIKTRAKPLNINVVVDSPDKCIDEDYFGAIFQNPNTDGHIRDFSNEIKALKNKGSITIIASDLLALCLIKTPNEMGADISVGSSQRFGVPMGFGGPHAAFMSVKEELKRFLPGRLVGASVDQHGKVAYRLALQTREQHIRREKATSNICTAQALLAIIAGFYAVYHGPKRLRLIAEEVNRKAARLSSALKKKGFKVSSNEFFDTVVVKTEHKTKEYFKKALDKEINLKKNKESLSISIDETVTEKVLNEIFSIFSLEKNDEGDFSNSISQDLIRKTEYMQHPVFNTYHSETEMLRYIKRLYEKDIALDRAMIPLGSCTMKLNATSEMLPVSWPEFSSIHPFAPEDQVTGYKELIEELENQLETITGYNKISLQPNAGSQGEYAGLLAIDAFHKRNGDKHRNICLIPMSAHGTNPASAQMVGMEVVPVKCDKDGNIDLEDLSTKAKENSENLSSIMITYPSTHGVFESKIKEVCKIVHSYQGQVYIDGANLNAMIGLCYPGKFGGDVSHLNLHKTFCIPHGGGGPGVGPIGVSKHLKDFLPGSDSDSLVGPVSATEWGSASILPISWMYIKMMGGVGLRKATEAAILSANYIAFRLKNHYEILYKGDKGLVAHECIVDVRALKESAGIEVEDIAKRLIDYGFHAPTMSWPVAGTLMIEPTESESKLELDRFCDAMIEIRKEIKRIEKGTLDKKDNMLKNAPHCAEHLTGNNWKHGYSRSEAAFPLDSLRENKYWCPVGRIDNVYGDRNLVCSCPSMEDLS
ncbi:MAG: glycine dehydrogenase (aminomethyl-transferring) [Gammaproteobacteria bacterium]|nr:glycine dehydrogenase (aminomethyl-transferring) [Gammaproteobacteria bacterium]